MELTTGVRNIAIGRMTKDRVTVVLLGWAMLFSSGCKPKPAEISSLQRKQGANFVSEAEFAVTLRDFARAEDLYRQATEACPDNGEYWLNLGGCRRRLEKRTEAKKAYESALAAYRDAYALDAHDPVALIQQVYVLALLGRTDAARAVLAKARSAHADDARVRNLTDAAFDQMLADPNFKALAL
jgi:tetratricopeptide (TPR) repeat protein